MLLHTLVAIVTLLLCLSTNNASLQQNPQTELKNKDEIYSSYWLKRADSSLDERLLREPIKAEARNVIVFLGDGMSIPTITAARILKGQLAGQTGEEASLSFDSFPWSGLAKTYCVNSQVPDSSCTATALLSGVKTNRGTIGVSPAVKVGDCKSMTNTSNHVESILTWAQRAMKSTGIVTTTRITHASPAGAYAHTADRDWEDDSKVQRDNENPIFCEDIASQLINRSPGKDINVILGGGRQKFRSENVKDEEQVKGRRKDGKDLIKAWIKDKKSKNVTASYVWNRDELVKIDTRNTDYMLGLFSHDHIPYFLDYKKQQHPTLAEMTKVAIEILGRNTQGYFLFVEGGRIDHAHHSNEARKALHETLEFSKAIQQAVDMTSQEDTLIVVTADHAHTMSISGYPQRGNDILGVGGISDVDELPYATLSYANGPSYKSDKNGRPLINELNLIKKNFKYPSMIPMKSETHGGDDVAVFALGCWAHLFSGVMDQNVIPMLISYASCLGPHRTYCKDMTDVDANKPK